MSFLSLGFGLFVVVVGVLYYSPPFKQRQLPLLVVASLFFISWEDWRFLPLFFVTTVVSVICLRMTGWPTKARLFVGIAVNLAVLVFFKYKVLLFDSSYTSVNHSAVEWLLMLPLPVGISFFVFHNISMLVDGTKHPEVMRGSTMLKSFLYIFFFPQLVCGPITRAQQFFPQIRPKYVQNIPWVSSLRWIVAGYFMKAFCADNLQQFTVFMDTTDGLKTLGGIDRIIMVLLYSFQIYADFYGYSAIAIGLALLFGYRLPINFNLPYIAASFSNFWHRWHISLSTWLQKYLYIPLGGNRKGPMRTEINLLLTMGLGGIWHGAGLNYLVWGLLHGVFLCVERPFRRFLQPASGLSLARQLSLFAYSVFVFLCVSFAWLLFKMSSFELVWEYIAGIKSHPWDAFHSVYFYMLAAIYSLPVVLQHVFHKVASTRLFVRAEPAFYAVLLLLTVVEAGPSTAFIYFQF